MTWFDLGSYFLSWSECPGVLAPCPVLFFSLFILFFFLSSPVWKNIAFMTYRQVPFLKIFYWLYNKKFYWLWKNFAVLCWFLLNSEVNQQFIYKFLLLLPYYRVQKFYRNIIKLTETDSKPLLSHSLIDKVSPKRKEIPLGRFPLDYCIWLKLFKIVQRSNHLFRTLGLSVVG